MSVEHFRGLCEQYRGRPVEIRTREGEVHRCKIQTVDRCHVFVQPLGRCGLGGFGYGFGGFGPGYGGYGYGRGYRIALGAIAAISLIPLVFW